MKRVIVTGSAGFIGFHLCKRLLEDDWHVFGIDALTSYYDVNLKKARNKILTSNKNFQFIQERIENKDEICKILGSHKPNILIHLAAQAGVRYSIDNPDSYVSSNLVGTFNLLEAVKNVGCKHFLMASTSSVYGGNKIMPYKETDKSDIQMSFYAATKKSNEIMTHSYAHIFDIPVTCFRFFTVFGPWGRPDMALFKFTKRILDGEAIDVYNGGKMERDFTYIDDIVKEFFV